ncbi:DUF1800 domain-containing protein [uncultured Litoreibacter sp.]|uniref:DUF1800 domain-containing protein n=1 Tax=uncultured Litoreibacter sp. TaxID=1392394 RepID=UPI0026052180|nr:DUF1800 domain-containing protein [uncultured Litoreibacter sp.]
MGFSPEVAAIRFGEGLSPDVAAPRSVAALLDQLTSRDDAAKAHPVPHFETLRPRLAKVDQLRRIYRQARDTADAAATQKAYADARGAARKVQETDLKHMLARSIRTQAPFRERLTRFWADHFTVIGKNAIIRHAVPHYIEEAIRPNIAGRFSDLLKAAVLHPMMLQYLDQIQSFGPNSPAARGRRGLNENLARELIELHTMGVGAGYSQTDVRQLSELLTGLTANLQRGFIFAPKRAEPGAETILGKTYGGGKPAIADIHAALDDLAAHPDTARHVARKLAVHFTSDTPDAGLIQSMTEAYMANSGALMPVYQALLEHPFTWDSFGQKVKQPIDLALSSMRVLAVPANSLLQLNRNQLRSYLGQPMAAMGQPIFAPNGPDGWPEEAEYWITPQGLAARLQWSLSMPSVVYRSLPDPRDFVGLALGDIADQRVIFAAQSAETRREGVGLVLASPAFQRR